MAVQPYTVGAYWAQLITLHRCYSGIVWVGFCCPLPERQLTFLRLLLHGVQPQRDLL